MTNNVLNANHRPSQTRKANAGGGIRECPVHAFNYKKHSNSFA